MSQSPTDATNKTGRSYVAGWNALYEMLRGDGSFSGREPHCAYLNTGGGRWAHVSAVTGLGYPDDGRGAAVVDWDRDGRLDLWVCNRTGPRVRFLRNQSPTEHRWAAVRLEGRSGNRDAIGARAMLWTRDAEGEQRLSKSVRAGEGYLAQSSKWLHFGIGRAEIERLEVRWPGGTVETFKGLSPNARYEIVEGAAIASRWSGPDTPAELAPAETPKADMSENARVVLSARLPMPPLGYETRMGKTAPLTNPAQGPVLINVWASWCAPCVEELTDWAKKAEALRAAGIRVVALTADEDATLSKAYDLFDRLRWPHESGRTSPELLDVLDVIQRSTIDKQQRLALPTSFLIDHRGFLAVLYRGPVKASQVVVDAALLRAKPETVRLAATPFHGRWLMPVAQRDLAGVANRFRKQGFPKIAGMYLKLHETMLAGAGADVENDRLARIEYNLGVSLMRERKFKEAAESFRKAVASDPGYARAHINLGICLKKQGDVRGAVAEYREALRLEPDHVAAHQNLAIALTELGRHAEAKQHLAEVRRLAERK